MYTDHFAVIKDKTTAQLPEVKTVQYYNNQYERTEELKAVGYPAIYIEFPATIDNWMQQGNGVQIADVEIRFHIVVNDLGDDPEILLNLAKQHFQVFNKKDLRFPFGAVDADQVSTELVRSSTSLITSFDQVKVMIIGYETSIIDCSAVPATQAVNISTFTIGNNT